MGFDESHDRLIERAEWIEGLEGTVKYEYTSSSDDLKDFKTASRGKLIVMMAMTLIAGILLAVAAIMCNDISLAVAAGMIFASAIILIFVIITVGRKRDVALDEVKLSFNAYGVSMRVTNGFRCCIFAYAWEDFENITEYKRIIVGMKDGIAFIFPKRIISEEDRIKFKNWSSVLGNRCHYKKNKA